MTIPAYLMYEQLLRDLKGLDNAIVECFKILLDRVQILEDKVEELERDKNES